VWPTQALDYVGPGKSPFPRLGISEPVKQFTADVEVRLTEMIMKVDFLLRDIISFSALIESAH